MKVIHDLRAAVDTGRARSALACFAASASERELAQFALLAAGGTEGQPIFTGTADAVRAQCAHQRFVQLTAALQSCSADSSEWVVTYDRRHHLYWLVDPVAGGDRNWSDGVQAAAAVRMFNNPHWRAPEVFEVQGILDYSMHGPALPAGVLRGPYNWTWTATRSAESPASYAWGVFVHGGDCYLDNQSGRGSVRAVLAGHQLGLRF